MAIDRLPDPSDPDAVGRAEFATARRGFDQIQVRSYLTVVARELKRLKDREAELTRETESLRAQLDDAKRDAAELDEAALTARLGEEMTKVLETARSASAEKLRRAEETAQELLADANAEAERILDSAQGLVDAEVNAARERGRELVAEARLVRERMLDDLARRRRNLRTQVEQLRSGRDRLLATHAAVRAALDEIEAEIERELPESRVAAELTGRRLQHEPAGSASMIEMEIDEARRAGAPLVSADEIAAQVDEEPAEWVNAGAAVVEDEGAAPAETVEVEHTGEHTDEIPVLDHFGASDEPGHQIVLSEVGHRRRDHRDLPREPVPVIEAPDVVEEVRVVAAAGEEPPAKEHEVEAAAEEMVEEPVEVEIAEPAVEEAEPQPAPEPVEAAAEPEPEPPVAEAGPTPEPEPQPQPEPPAAEAEPERVTRPEPASEPEAAASPVDDLFARIRSSRAENVARAREVLDQPFESSAPAGTRTIVAPAEPAAPAAATGAAEAEADVAEPEPVEDLSPDSQLLAERDHAVAGIETVIARKLKRLLADEQNEIQDLVRRQRGNVRREEVLGSREHHVGRYLAAVGGELLAAVSAGASFHNPGGHAKDTDLGALDERLAAELLDPLRQLLGRGVDDTSGDEDELLDRVRSAYREVKSQRVETAARVVTLAAFNVGIVEAQPEGALLRWVVDPVAGCSPDCLDNELAGAVAAGEPFPTGDAYPPAHPGCRCLLVPTDQ